MTSNYSLKNINISIVKGMFIGKRRWKVLSNEWIVCDSIKNFLFFLTNWFNDVVKIKLRNLWPKKDKEKFQWNLKFKNIINITLGINKFFHVSHCNIAKEMWNTLQVTREGTIEIKRHRMKTLIYEFELFKTIPQ